MTARGAGWFVFLAALGMMMGLLGAELAQMKSFGEALTPGFFGKGLIHVSSVIAAFVGGKIIPTTPAAWNGTNRRKGGHEWKGSH